MGYKRVYAPNGAPFDVPEFRADALILQHGWTQQPVSVAAAESVEFSKQPRPKRRHKRNADSFGEGVAEKSEDDN